VTENGAQFRDLNDGKRKSLVASAQREESTGRAREERGGTFAKGFIKLVIK